MYSPCTQWVNRGLPPVDGVLVTMSERMEKMEARMAEQELEIVELRRKVSGSRALG